MEPTNTLERRTDNWIQTASGISAWPTAPRSEDIRIEDIAHALSHLCRFTGHTREFYSVAQHSVRVMKGVEAVYASWGEPELIKTLDLLWALLHDAEEAYINDLSTPVKRLPEMSNYAEIAANLREFIVTKYGLGAKEPYMVSEIDQAMLVVEANELMVPTRRPGSILERIPAPPPGLIPYSKPWGPKRARREFLYHFWRLMGKLEGRKGLDLYAYAASRCFRR